MRLLGEDLFADVIDVGFTRLSSKAGDLSLEDAIRNLETPE